MTHADPHASPPDDQAHDSAPVAPAMEDIRGVLIQVTGGRLLMPNAAIAEVLSYADPEPVPGTPDWLLGLVRWRGWQLPLVAFSRLAGIAEEKPGLGNKMIVLKAFGGQGSQPFFAVLTQGFPRLVTVTRTGLVAVEEDAPLPAGVLGRVLHNDEPALLPDVAQLETLLDAALAGRDAGTPGDPAEGPARA